MITQNQVQEALNQGYTMDQINTAISEEDQDIETENVSPLQQSYQNAMAMNQNDPRCMASNTSVSGNLNQDNLIKWQLELDSILERVEHMLKGDKPKFINGNMIFITPTDPREIILNDFGVAEVMRVLSMYLNRNTILSNYDEDTINWKMLDFGNEITDLIYLKYESMGMDTLEKRKLFPIITREIVDIVHSAYLRALNGGERLSLREARQISQNETIMPGGMSMMNGQPVMKERSMLNPMRYLKGKYG